MKCVGQTAKAKQNLLSGSSPSVLLLRFHAAFCIHVNKGWAPHKMAVRSASEQTVAASFPDVADVAAR
jgi:hypothetical protein